MNRIQVKLGVFAATAMALSIPALGNAGRVSLLRDDVVPVIFETRISMQDTHQGDKFTVRVDDDNRLPRGTRFEGHVLRVRPAVDDRPAVMDLQFDEIRLPSGAHARFDGVPVPLNEQYLRRNSDGRWVVKKDARKRENYLLGGAVGGFVLGTVFKKPVEGTIIGVLAGIIAGETDKKNDGNVVIQKGQKVGALVDRDLQMDFRERDEDRASEGNERPWQNGQRLDIQLDGRPLRFLEKEEPYRIGQTVMVPLDAFAEQLKLDVDHATSTRVYISNEDSEIRLQRDSTDYRVNGKRGKLSQPVTIRNEILYVPIEVFTALRKQPITVNGDRIRIEER